MTTDFFELTSKLLDPLTVKVGDVWHKYGTYRQVSFFIVRVQGDSIIASVCNGGLPYLGHMNKSDFAKLRLVVRDGVGVYGKDIVDILLDRADESFEKGLQLLQNNLQKT